MTPVFCVCSSTSGLSSSSDFNLLRMGFGGGARGVVPLPWETKHYLSPKNTDLKQSTLSHLPLLASKQPQEELQFKAAVVNHGSVHVCYE